MILRQLYHISSTAFLEVFKLLAQKLLPTICSPEPTKRYVSHGLIVSGFLMFFFFFLAFIAFQLWAFCELTLEAICSLSLWSVIVIVQQSKQFSCIFFFRRKFKFFPKIIKWCLESKIFTKFTQFSLNGTGNMKFCSWWRNLDPRLFFMFHIFLGPRRPSIFRKAF